MILERYLAREVLTPVAVILGTLVALFGSYAATTILGDAVNELLPIQLVLAMVGLKVLISLEVLIPIALFLSVVLTFSRLQGDSEITAMFAAGISPARLLTIVFTLASLVAVAVAALSILVRPLAYHKLHELSRQAAASVDVNVMQPGIFYGGRDGSRLMHIGARDRRSTLARDVFVRLKNSEGLEIITSALAYPLPRSPTGEDPEAYLSQAHIYKIPSDQDSKVVTARGLILDPNMAVAPAKYSALDTASAHLAGSRQAGDIAEWQWRLSTPVSTILLAMLGVLLSRTETRQGRFARFGVAIAIYTGYYLAVTAARTWVQHGAVAAFPGIWWGPGLLALFVVIGFGRSNIGGAAARGYGVRPRRRPVQNAP